MTTPPPHLMPGGWPSHDQATQGFRDDPPHIQGSQQRYQQPASPYVLTNGPHPPHNPSPPFQPTSEHDLNSVSGDLPPHEQLPSTDYDQGNPPYPPALYEQSYTPEAQEQPPYHPQARPQYPPPHAQRQQWPQEDQNYQSNYRHTPHQFYSPRQGEPLAPPPHMPPSRHDEHHYSKQSHYHYHKPVKQYISKGDQTEPPHIRVIHQGQDSGSSSSKLADQMQAMMMNQMMMQQMQSQQMQAAQMAAMTQQSMQNMQSQAFHHSNNFNSNNNNNNIRNSDNGDGRPRKRNKSRGSINIHSVQQKTKRKVPKTRVVHAGAPPPPQDPKIIVLPQQPPSGPPTLAPPNTHVDSLALDNWQEATIILCFAAIGLIYLICSRASGEKEEKKPSVAREHMS